MSDKRPTCTTCGSSIYGEYGDLAGELLEAAKAVLDLAISLYEDAALPDAVEQLEIVIGKAEGRS